MVILVLRDNPDLDLHIHQAQYILCTFNGDLRVNPLMSPFRVLLALNIISLILDTVGDVVNTVLITTTHRIPNESPPYVIDNKFQSRT